MCANPKGPELFASHKIREAVQLNLVSIAHDHAAAGMDIARVISNPGPAPFITVIGFRQSTGQPVIEVDFNAGSISKTIVGGNEGHARQVESLRYPGSIEELVEIYRGHLSYEFGFLKI